VGWKRGAQQRTQLPKWEVRGEREGSENSSLQGTKKENTTHMDMAKGVYFLWKPKSVTEKPKMTLVEGAVLEEEGKKKKKNLWVRRLWIVSPTVFQAARNVCKWLR